MYIWLLLDVYTLVKLRYREISNCGVGEHSWQSLGQQRVQTNQS